jgi:hypothetical protein
MKFTTMRALSCFLVLAMPAVADIYVNGTFAGTFYNNGVNPPIDTLGIFSSPGTDLTGQTINGSFTYDASTLPLTGSSLGSTQYQAANNGSVTETVNGVPVNFGTSAYMSLILAQPPAYLTDDLFDLETANYTPANAVSGQNFVYQYVRIEALGPGFLNGLGNVQQFSVANPSVEVGGVDIIESFTYNANTGTYNPYVVDELPFVSDLTVTATPEPAMLPFLGVGFAGLGILCVRRRRSTRAMPSNSL